MLTRLHTNATTTSQERAEIEASSEPVSVLTARYGVSETTIRHWRARTTGAAYGAISARPLRRSRRRSSPNSRPLVGSALMISPLS